MPKIKSLDRLLFSISVAPYELDRRPSRNWDSSKSSLVSFERQNHRFRQISLFMGYSKWRISSQKETTISRHRLNQVPTDAEGQPVHVPYFLRHKISFNQWKANQCAFYNNKLYMTGNNNQEIIPILSIWYFLRDLYPSVLLFMVVSK